MGIEAYVNNYIRPGAWAHPDTKECGCRGRGWWLSELDSWHECRYHHRGQPHPDEMHDVEDYASEPPVVQNIRWAQVTKHQGNFSVDASDIGWIPGVSAPLLLTIEGRPVALHKTVYTPGGEDIGGWVYVSARTGARLTVWND